MPAESRVYRCLVVAACLVVIVAGLRAATSWLIPFLLAAFFAVILSPILHWLQRKRVPSSIALLLILFVFTLLGSGVVLMVGQSFNDFSKKVPEYQTAVVRQSEVIASWLEEYGIEIPAFPTQEPEYEDVPGAELPLGAGEAPSTVTEFVSDTPQTALPLSGPEHMLDLKGPLQLVSGMLSGLSSIFSNALIVLITVVFMLLEAARLPAKLAAALDKSSAAASHIDVIIGNVRRYVAIKAMTSALTGLLVTGLLLALGIDYASLWGLLAFLFNFVPNIGSMIAAVPPIGLAALQGGVPSVIPVAIGLVAINGFISYAIEPRFMGQGLGLSTLVVFLSLVFWGWVLGPIGMLLSAPLTMTVKIVLEDYDETRWIAVLLSAKSPPTS